MVSNNQALGITIGLGVVAGILCVSTPYIGDYILAQNSNKDPTPQVQTLTPGEISDLVTPIPSMALSHDNNLLLGPRNNVNYNTCFTDAFEKSPITDYGLTVLSYHPLYLTLFNETNSDFPVAVTIINAQNKNGEKQYFIYEGIKDFPLNQKIIVDYWKFLKDFSLSTNYLGCFLGNEDRRVNNAPDRPIRSEREDGKFDGFIEYTSLRYIGE
jgi:hypothetical protein